MQPSAYDSRGARHETGASAVPGQGDVVHARARRHPMSDFKKVCLRRRDGTSRVQEGALDLKGDTLSLLKLVGITLVATDFIANWQLPGVIGQDQSH